MKLNLSLFTFLFSLSCLTITAQSPVDTTLSLQNVTVQGKHFSGLSRGEIQRLSVENNLSSITGTTAEAFRQLPSLITDIEGGVAYRGSNHAGMLVNSIPYGLLEEYNGDVLIQLPALFFNHISLSAFPFVEYIPDGDAGVLNLSSTAFSSFESPLQVIVGVGLQERYNAGTVINLHPGKLHITGKYNYRKEYRKRSFKKTTTNVAGTTEMDNNASARPDVHLADLSIGYDLTPQDTVTVYGLYHLMQYDRYGGINNTKKNPEGETVNKILRHRFNSQRQEAYATEARWNHQFNNPQEQLNVTFNYNNFSYDEDNNFKNEKPETGVILAQDKLFVGHTKNNYYFSTSYHKLFSNRLLLKGGYTGRFRDESYTAEAFDLKEDTWLPNQQKSNDYSFNRFTNMLFASIEKKFRKLTVESGIQGEHQKQTINGSNHSNIHLYPRLRLSYPTRNTGELTLKYVQRVNRPSGMDLNPFIDMSDATYIRQGNPDLKNEYTHTLEASYRMDVSNIRLLPSIYYRNRRNRIMDVVTKQNEQTIWKRENIGHTQTVGLELSGSYSPINPLSIGLSANIYNDEIDGRLMGYNEKKSLVCWDIKGNINFSLTPTTDMQIDGFYISDQLTPQGKIKSRYSINAGISQHLLDDKLRIHLSMQNIFNSLAETTIINTEQMQMTQIRNRDPRVAWISLIVQL